MLEIPTTNNWTVANLPTWTELNLDLELLMLFYDAKGPEMCKNSNQFIYKAQCHRANQDCRKILGSNAQHFFWMTVLKRVINDAVKWKHILKNMGQRVISNH